MHPFCTKFHMVWKQPGHFLLVWNLDHIKQRGDDNHAFTTFSGIFIIITIKAYVDNNTLYDV